jgi:hypothetical protein
MIHFRPLFVAIALSLLSGCAHHYTPDASRPFEPITEFSSNNSINLVNGQPSKQDVQIFSNGLHQFYGNFNAWTDTAIEITSRELTKRGLTVVAGAPKTLTLSVESANYDQGMVELKTHIDMRVRTSDGYSAVYVGENASFMMAIPSRQIDGAMMRVVHEMFMDPHIVAFLTQ